MIGWRRRAKAVRENTVSPERLYELVSQTLMENVGPLGSFAITRRSAADTDDIFHTALVRSVARDIVANLAEHGITVRSDAATGHAAMSLAPIEAVPVPRQLARAVSAAAQPAVAQPAVARPVAAPAPVLRRVETVPSYPTTQAGVAIGAMPLIDGPDPLDDDALRSLVAHHNEVTEAVARRQATIAI